MKPLTGITVVDLTRMLLTLDVPGLGAFRVLGNPVKMSSVAAGSPAAPPRLGEHTEAVLRSLGYTARDIDRITQRTGPA